MTQESEIEKACASVATAMAKLIAAVRAVPAADNIPELDAAADTDGKAHLDLSNTKERRLFVYCAGAKGLAQLSQDQGPKIKAAYGLSTPYISKIGTTRLDLPTRLRQIGQDRYAAAIRTDDGIKVEGGFSAWVAHAISTTRLSHDPAVTVLPRAIAVDRPAGLTARAFDAALHRALRDRALNALPTSICPRRYVPYDLVETRVSAAKELYAICPYDSDDGDRLLAAVEGIVGRFRERHAAK